MITIRCGTRKGSFVYRTLARSHTLMQEVPDLGTRIDLSICWGAFAIEVKILEGDTGDRVDPRQKAPASAC